MTESEPSLSKAGPPIGRRCFPTTSGFIGPLVVGAIAFILYTLTLSKQYFGDGIQFAIAIETNDLASILHPNHMLYTLIGLGFYRVWELFGWQNGALLPLQMLSALGGGLAVGLMYAIMTKLTESRKATLLTSFGFAVSVGIWRYSIDAESVTIPLAASLLLLYVLLSNRDSASMKSAVMMGTLCFVSIVTYGTGVLLALPILVGYFMDSNLTWRLRVRQASVFGLVAGSLSAAAFVFVAFTVAKVTSWTGLTSWYFQTSSYGFWGKPSPYSLVQGANGLVRALVAYPGITPTVSTPGWLADASTGHRILWAIVALFVSIVLVFPVAFAIRRRRQLWPEHHRTLAILATWGITYGVFALYWIPGDPSFWVPALVPWWLLVGISVSSNTAPARAVTTAKKKFEAGFALAVLAGVAVGCANLIFTIAPNRRSDCAYQIAIAMKEHTDPEDLIITSGGGSLFLTIPYFGHRDTVSLLHEIIKVRTQESDDSSIGPARSDLQIKEKALVDIDGMARDTRKDGGRVFLAGVYPGLDWRILAQSVGIQKEDFSHFESHYAWTTCGDEIREVLPK